MIGYIYIIKNDINTKVYIGKTTTAIQDRFKDHIYDAKRKKNEKRPLYSAINKYGIEHFWIEEIEQVDLKYLEEREIYWINYFNSYKNGYNATFGGDGKILFNYEEIVNLYKNGLLQKEIAKQINCSEDTVFKVLKSNHINSNINQYNRLKHAIIMIKNNEQYEFNSQMDAAKWLIKNNLTISKDPDNVCGSIGRAIKNNKKYLGYIWKYKKK